MNVRLLRAYLSSPDFEQKLNHRIERLQNAESNPVERMNIFMDCREDFFVWADLFGVAYEPRLPEMPDIPMFLFPHQREMCVRMIDAEEQAHDLFIEKTRDMMATWTALHYMYWRWRFKQGWYGLIGSRKEEEVDNRGPSSLFGKLRYIHYAQPQWLRPQKFRKSENDLHLKLINPDNNAYIDGESANPNFGRGRRCVSGDTLILTPRGLRKIREFIESGEREVISPAGEVKKVRRYIVVPPKEPLYVLTLQGGLSIHSTADHPILTVRRNKISERGKNGKPMYNEVKEWKNVGELTGKERIVLADRDVSKNVFLLNDIQEKGGIVLNEDMAKLLGYLVAEGCVIKYGMIGFTSTDGKMLDD